MYSYECCCDCCMSYTVTICQNGVLNIMVYSENSKDLGANIKVMCVDNILTVTDMTFFATSIFKVWPIKHLQILGIYLLFKDKQITNMYTNINFKCKMQDTLTKKTRNSNMKL